MKQFPQSNFTNKETIKMNGSEIGSAMDEISYDSPGYVRPTTKKHIAGCEFVKWDGSNELPYSDSDFTEDVMLIPSDSAMAPSLIPIPGVTAIESKILLVSVDRIRKKAIEINANPIVVFGCKSNSKTTERKLNGRWNGIFTKCFHNAIGFNPKQNLRTLIYDTNRRLAKLSSQRCEVICTFERLNRPWMPTNEATFRFHFSGHGAENSDLENPRLRDLPLKIESGHNVYMTFDMCRI